jgi:hypothetical protein
LKFLFSSKLRIISITRRSFLLVIIIFSAGIVYSQKTVISGKVTDAVSLEPVGFVDVYFKNTSIGCRTNFEGYYTISTDSPLDSLSVRFLGYYTLTKPIIKGDSQVVDFLLQPSVQSLNEVVILPGENPAVTLLKKVWKNKNSCNIEKLDAYQYQSYSKTQVYLRKFFNPSEIKDTASDNVFNSFCIATDENSIPALPVYMSEVLSDIYYVKSPQCEKVMVNKTNTNSLANVETDMVTQLIQKSVWYNFNDNFIKILDKNFISPISTNGEFYYKYYLTDSIYIDGKRCYEIRVKAKRKEDLAFNGTIWINDTTFALKRVSVEIGKAADLNFIKRIKIQQDLMPVDSNVWAPSKTRILADAVNIFISSYTYNDKYVVDQPKPSSFYNKEIEISENVDDATAEDWNKIRPQSLNSTDSLTLHNIDSLKRRLGIKLLTALVAMSIKEYVNLGKIELGPFILVYRHNDLEGNRFRLGFRTNSVFSKQWIFKGFLAYGTNDKKFKYNAQVEKFLSRKSWTKVGIQYSEDLENVGALDEFYENSSFVSLASSFGGSDKLNKMKLGRCWVESDLFKGFTQKIIFLNKTLSPASSDFFFAYYADPAKTQLNSDITLSEVTFSSIYQSKATFIIDKNERFPVLFKKAPVFILNYTIGFKNILNSDFNYHKASLEIKHNFLLGGMGNFTYNLRFTKVFTPLPYTMLNIFAGNESFFRSDKMYNLMNYGEFVADQSAELFCSYNMQGFFLNKFPLIKKLGLRTVASLHAIYGSFNAKKNGIYNSTGNPEGILSIVNMNGDTLSSFNTLQKDKPYIEVSYGVENIFRFFRIDFIHRLTYLNYDGMDLQNKPKKFGIKISAAFKF